MFTGAELRGMIEGKKYKALEKVFLVVVMSTKRNTKQKPQPLRGCRSRTTV